MFKRRNQDPDGQQRPRSDRRRASRQPADWDSGFVVMPEARQYSYVSKSDYAACTLRDLSMEGVGVQLADGSVEIGDRVVLDLPLGERQRASIQLTGEVRHAAPDRNGVVMAGIQFVDVGALERALLYRLLRDLGPRARQTA